MTLVTFICPMITKLVSSSMTVNRFVLMLLLVVSFAAPAQDLYTFVFLHKRSDLPQLPKEEVDKIMEGHMANMKRLATDGKLIAAGPFEGGGGIFIFKSGSTQAEVKDWISTDPGVVAQRWNIEILSYAPYVGGVCSVKEPYEMVTYTFVHFKPNVMKFNVQDGEETVKKHDDFIRSIAAGGNVITASSFGGLDGGILVMKGDVQQEVILQDPSVVAGLYEPEFKKLWIARGAFCEK
jgi:uncharacterized protein YciI